MKNSCSPETEKVIREAARLQGVPENFLLTMANIESTCNPKAVNAKTDATGLYQFLPKAAQDTKLKLSDRTDASLSAIAAAKYTKQNIKYLRHYGVAVDLNVNPEYGYLAHQQGALGLSEIIKAANKDGVVTHSIRTNMDNNFGSGLTPKQFLEAWKLRYQQMANGQLIQHHAKKHKKTTKGHHHHPAAKHIYQIPNSRSPK